MEKTRNVGNDLTEGSVAKKLIMFSIPLIGAYLLQSLYSMVDMLIVSRLAGTYSMSAVNIVAQVAQVVTGGHRCSLRISVRNHSDRGPVFGRRQKGRAAESH